MTADAVQAALDTVMWAAVTAAIATVDQPRRSAAFGWAAIACALLDLAYRHLLRGVTP